jgi:hypothetical protein
VDEDGGGEITLKVELWTATIGRDAEGHASSACNIAAVKEGQGEEKGNGGGPYTEQRGLLRKDKVNVQLIAVITSGGRRTALAKQSLSMRSQREGGLNSCNSSQTVSAGRGPEGV